MVLRAYRRKDVTRVPSATASRRAICPVLAAIRIAVLVLLGLLLSSEPATAQCDQDLPTEASLRAAQTAIASGAMDVALSPGGCLRYRRSPWPGVAPAGGPEHQREETSFAGQIIEQWEYHHIGLPPPPGENRP
jgi:hypothetical protein